MSVAELDGIEIAYELVGEGQPWALTPGGRFTKNVGGLAEMARALADHGEEGPHVGSSELRRVPDWWCSVVGRSRRSRPRSWRAAPSSRSWAHGDRRRLGRCARPLLAAARHPDVTAGLAMWWISGGVPGLLQLANYYCMPSADAAWHGGMEAVVELEQWRGGAGTKPGGTDSVSCRWIAGSSSR